MYKQGSQAHKLSQDRKITLASQRFLELILNFYVNKDSDQ